VKASTDQPQHMQALSHANEVRLSRAELKRQILRRERSVEEVLADIPPEAESMRVVDLLRAQRGWGYTRARKLLVLLAISESKTVGALTDRQREMLAKNLGTPARLVPDQRHLSP
jgi:hypothetical protein